MNLRSSSSSPTCPPFPLFMVMLQDARSGPMLEKHLSSVPGPMRLLEASCRLEEAMGHIHRNRNRK